jgi:Family of unknown function (DUF5647)
MSTPTIAAVDEITDKGFDLSRRWGLAVIDNPSLLDEIPDGANLVLVPDDDPAFAEAKIELGIAAVRRGENVYFRHVRAADLPE